MLRARAASCCVGTTSITSPRTITTTGALTGSSPGSATLNLANALGQFGPFDVSGSGSTLTLNDASGGLALSGNVTINTGALSITTAGGALALGTYSITANAGSTAAMAVGTRPMPPHSTGM